MFLTINVKTCKARNVKVLEVEELNQESREYLFMKGMKHYSFGGIEKQIKTKK